MIQCKCLVSEMTCNTFNDCDQMFFSEFKQLVDYSIQKYEALYSGESDEGSTELDMLPRMG